MRFDQIPALTDALVRRLTRRGINITRDELRAHLQMFWPDGGATREDVVHLVTQRVGK